MCSHTSVATHTRDMNFNLAFDAEWWQYLVEEERISSGKQEELVIFDHTLLIAKELLRQGITIDHPVQSALNKLTKLQTKGDTLELAVLLNELPEQWDRYRVVMQQLAREYFTQFQHIAPDFRERYFARMTFRHMFNDVWLKYIGPPPNELELLQQVQKWLRELDQPTGDQLQVYKKAKIVKSPLNAFPISAQQLRVVLGHKDIVVKELTDHLTPIQKTLRDALDTLATEHTEETIKQKTLESGLETATDQVTVIRVSGSAHLKVVDYMSVLVAATEQLAKLAHKLTDKSVESVLQPMETSIANHQAATMQKLTTELESDSFKDKISNWTHAKILRSKGDALRRAGVSVAIEPQLKANHDKHKQEYRTWHDRVLMPMANIVDRAVFMLVRIKEYRRAIKANQDNGMSTTDFAQMYKDTPTSMGNPKMMEKLIGLHAIQNHELAVCNTIRDKSIAVVPMKDAGNIQGQRKIDLAIIEAKSKLDETKAKFVVIEQKRQDAKIQAYSQRLPEPSKTQKDLDAYQPAGVVLPSAYVGEFKLRIMPGVEKIRGFIQGLETNNIPPHNTPLVNALRNPLSQVEARMIQGKLSCRDVVSLQLFLHLVSHYRVIDQMK
jgi:hypothetical protein